jgi:hypothetical protein
MSRTWRRVSLAPLLLLPLAAPAEDGAGPPAPPRPLEEEIEIVPGPEENAPRPFRAPLLPPAPRRGGVSRCTQPVEDLSCYCLAGEGMRPCEATGGIVRAE